MLNSTTDPQVLSIQSHVISGYVGNKAAVFPLQVLGLEVHSINSVKFSNHTGYGNWKGNVLNSSELKDLMTGLENNKLDEFSHILTGYVGSFSFLEQLSISIQQLKCKNPNTVYLCDPVMGDNGHLYVPKELLYIYRDKLIPLADIVTPNQFEAELLTETKIQNDADAIESMKMLHNMGAKTVVISSSVLGSTEDCFSAFGSTRDGNDGPLEVWKIDIPRIPHLFTGTGDLFAALLLAWMHRSKGNLSTSMEKSIGTLQEVLRRTARYAEDQVAQGKPYGVKILELRLIQSKEDIENPPTSIKAVRLV